MFGLGKTLETKCRLWIELPRPENPANTYARHTETLDCCFDGFSGHGNLIHNIIPQLKKENVEPSVDVLEFRMGHHKDWFDNNKTVDS